MQGLVQVDRVGDVAVVMLVHPPVNALSADLRRGLAEALQTAFADAEISAWCCAAMARGSARALTLRSLASPFRRAARLGDLCLMIENAPKPVVAALHGTVLGGGLELALAAHYRISDVSARLGLPEVTLGLLPGAGARSACRV